VFLDEIDSATLAPDLKGSTRVPAGPRQGGRFRDKRLRKWDQYSMATPNESLVLTRAHAAKALEATDNSLEEELRRAEQDFASGDFIEITVDALDRHMAAGEWPWPSESSE
jgi:hypothetical protein